MLSYNLKAVAQLVFLQILKTIRLSYGSPLTSVIFKGQASSLFKHMKGISFPSIWVSQGWLLRSEIISYIRNYIILSPWME